VAFNPTVGWATVTDSNGNAFIYQNGTYYDKYGNSYATLPSTAGGWAAETDLFGSWLNGDNQRVSADSSYLRIGQQSTLFSGALYTALGNTVAMWYLSHNVALSSVGSYAGRDDAGPCSSIVYGEDEILHGLSAATGAAASVPTMTQSSFWNLLTGGAGFSGVARSTSLASAPITAATYTVDSGTLPDTHLLFNPSGAICTVTLPAAAAGNKGREITMRNLSGAYTIVSATSNVAPGTSATAGTAILAATAGKWALLVSDGAQWNIQMYN
jgi:hypothetical protein